ncbi:hypothetical protein HYY75_04885 [bacterium]|nr:hypothetical protein [bacterium]
MDATGVGNESEKDYQLLFWCLLVVLELGIIAHLTEFRLVMLLTLILFRPFKASLGMEIDPNPETPQEKTSSMASQPSHTLHDSAINSEKSHFSLLFEGNSNPISLQLGQKIKSPINKSGSFNEQTGFMAEVTHKPDDKSVLGLKNISEKEWVVQLPSGECRVSPQKSVALAPEMKIDFGDCKGSIHPSTDTGD